MERNGSGIGMRRLCALAAGMAAVVCAAGAAVAAADADSSYSALLAPPAQPRPVVVRAGFELRDINEINDVAETFEFSGVLTLVWKDPRQAFDPAAAGVEEKVFQGDYQFNEVSTGWYPQVVMVNQSGSYDKSGVVLRIRPNGTSTWIETVTGTAESDFDMRRFPFDRQRLELVFEVLGFAREEIALQRISSDDLPIEGVRIPQWTILAAQTTIRDQPASYAGRGGFASAFVVGIEVDRESFYIRRLVTFPLVVIVLLSFSVFWMDRSSLGDRISVSFIGILTGVAYQLVMGDVLPRISYVTLMHGFLTLSFLMMCATVVINLVVGWLDQTGRRELGDRIDRRCRWIFPAVYFGLVFVMSAVASFIY